MSCKKLSPSHKSSLTSLNDIHISTTLFEALSNENWRQAMNAEIEALQKNKTWEMVDLPIKKKTVGCKWVYTIKYRADETLERYKVRLVTKGYTQTYDVDHLETFVPIAKVNTIRILLSLVANNNRDLQQFNVKNAILNGNMKEDIYMKVPPRVGSGPAPKKVCKMKKVLYGLKRSPRVWFERFAKISKSIDHL